MWILQSAFDYINNTVLSSSICFVYIYVVGSSDYSAPQTHRAMLIHDGEIYQPSSESSGSNNDYTSLKGQRFSRTNDCIYYPTSEGEGINFVSSPKPIFSFLSL